MANRHTIPTAEEAAALVTEFETAVKQSKWVLAVDFEATCCDKGSIPRDQSEIIEFGATLVDIASGQRKFSFSEFVKPQLHPILTPFCTELTTITQADVDGGLPFNTVCEILETTIANATNHEPMIWVSWGQYDFNQLRADCSKHKIDNPLPVKHFNLKAVEAAYAGRKQIGLDGAVKTHGLTWHGTHHRGVDDAVNVSNIFNFLTKDLI